MTERIRAVVISEDADDLVACYAALTSKDRWEKFGRPPLEDIDALSRMAITLHLHRRDGASSPPAAGPSPRSIPADPLGTQQALGGSKAVPKSKASAKAVSSRKKPYSGPTIDCPMCHETKPWTIQKEIWPGAVCMDCFKAGRTA